MDVYRCHLRQEIIYIYLYELSVRLQIIIIITIDLAEEINSKTKALKDPASKANGFIVKLYRI